MYVYVIYNICNIIYIIIFIQCHLVRDYYIANPRERRRLMEKSKASILFKGKKASYQSS